jgi:hypothetical protein
MCDPIAQPGEERIDAMLPTAELIRAEKRIEFLDSSTSRHLARHGQDERGMALRLRVVAEGGVVQRIGDLSEEAERSSCAQGRVEPG